MLGESDRARRPKGDTTMTKTIAISNLCGGDYKAFAFSPEHGLSDRAIRWARRCDALVGGVVFNSDVPGLADAAEAAWEALAADAEHEGSAVAS